MNNLKLDEQGGHPLTLDDLAFLQHAYTEAFKNVLIGLDEGVSVGYKLFGATAYYDGSTDTMWLSEGAVVIRYSNLAEVFYVPNHNTGIAPADFNNPYWRDDISNLAPSPVTYKNLAAKNVHKQRRLTLGVTGNNILYPRYNEVKDFTTVLKNKIKPSEFESLTSGSYAANYSGTIRHIEELHGWVTIDGTVTKNTTASTNDVMFTLPLGRRPSTQQQHILRINTPGETTCIVQINTNGTVVLVAGSLDAFTVYFPCIRFAK